MTMKRKRAVPKVRRSQRGGLRRFLVRQALVGLPFVLIAIGAYLAYVDYRIREEFDGKKWSLPARIYAAPVELFVGAASTPERLEQNLRDLKFRADPALATRATYARRGAGLVVKTRAFRFPDRLEPARTIRVDFDGGQISGLSDMDQQRSLAVLRLEPVQVGSFYPTIKEDRILIKLTQAPERLLQALFSVEDRDFYQHAGISARGILRAVWVNARSGAIVQGGSTLTQQLVKNLFLSAERTWWRKVNEAVMALILEARYSKQQILEAYLNEIYLGQDGARAIHGFALASQYYFGRSLAELELQHVATLVGLVRGPSYYDPFQAPERVVDRRNVVLDAMVEQHYITAEQAGIAKGKALDVVSNPHQPISPHPAFLDLLRRQLGKDYQPDDLTSEGLRIFTTLEVGAQRALEAAVTEGIQQLEQRKGRRGLETAGIVTRRDSGEIVALVGSRNPSSTGFNRALDAERQIGSLYKPVVYLTALKNSKRYTIASPLSDRAVRLKGEGGKAWTPSNYDGQEHGTVLLRTALAQSYNLATIRLGLSVGVERTLDTLRRMGVSRKVPAFPSLLLGAVNMTPLEVTQVYQTLAADGFTMPLTGIRAVTSRDGKVLQRQGLKPRRQTDSSAVFLVNVILQEAVSQGTGKPVYSFLPRHFNVVGKTGTTNDLRDSWFAGFTGDYLGVVWVGRDDNKPARLTGAQGALRIWGLTMRRIAREPVTLARPQNIVDAWVDRATGQRSDDTCPAAVRMPFIKGSVPPAGSACATIPTAAAPASDGLF